MLRIILLLAISAMGQQVYENPTLHGRYEVPAGWAMETPKANAFGVSWVSTRVGLQPVYMNFLKWGSVLESINHRAAFCFFNMDYFYDATASSPQAPLITEIMDTIAPSGTSYAMAVVKHVDLGRIFVSWASSNKEYSQTYSFSTTVADYETNNALYFQNWAKMSYYTAPVIAKSSAAASTQEQERLGLLDVLGRKRSATQGRRTTPQFYPLR